VLVSPLERKIETCDLWVRARKLFAELVSGMELVRFVIPAHGKQNPKICVSGFLRVHFKLCCHVVIRWLPVTRQASSDRLTPFTLDFDNVSMISDSSRNSLTRGLIY
jgi:hypothetical protein